MKFRQYIVTYNSPSILNEWALESIFSSLSDEELQKVEIYIINNHSNFYLYDKFKLKSLTILNNVLRPNFSTGHLSRNWNEGLINGFESLITPSVDAVILMQQDTKVEPNYINKLENIHKSGISFFTAGAGDQFMSLTSNAVKRVGIFDERFCGIGFQEIDYFVRQLLFNHTGSSINDYHHGRIYNPSNIPIVVSTEPGLIRKDNSHRESSKYHNYNKRLWYYKYKLDHWELKADEIISKGLAVLNKTPWFILYPYFEKDVETLQEQGYMFDEYIENIPWF
jgi:hypothetical protein